MNMNLWKESDKFLKAHPEIEIEREKELQREIEADRKKYGLRKANPTTPKHERELEKIIWKHFSKEFARNVMIANKRPMRLDIPGGEFDAYEVYTYSPEYSRENCRRARKEYFGYIRKHHLCGAGLHMSDLARAVVFYSNAIYSGYDW